MANETEAPDAPLARGLGARLKEALTYRGHGFSRDPGDVRFHHVAVIILVAVTIWGYVDVSRRGRIEPFHEETHRTDFTVYVEAGAAFFTGRDPYKVSNARGWTYLYPPMFALMVAPLAPFDTITQVSVWFAVCVALGFGCYFESRRIWRLVADADDERPPRPYPWPRFVACAVWAVLIPALDCLQRGQMGVALLYVLLLGYRLFLESRWRMLGGFVLAWAVVVKMIPALPVGFLVAQQFVTTRQPKARAWGLALGVTLGVFAYGLAIPSAFVGWRQNLHYLKVWSDKVALNKDPGQASGSHVDSYTNQSLTNAAHLLVGTFRGPVPEASKKVHWLVVDTAIANRRRADWKTRYVIRAVQVVSLGLLAAAGYRMARRGTRLGQTVTFGLASSLILLIGPVAWGHYYVFNFPAALFAPRWIWGRGRPKTASAVALTLALLPTLHYVAMSRVGDYGVLGLGMTLWFLAVCGLTLRLDPKPVTEGLSAYAGPHSARASDVRAIPEGQTRQGS